MKARVTIILVALSSFLLEVKAQQTLNENILHDNLTREYIVYVPAIYDGNAPVPLVFNFHGYTGRANWHMDGTRMRPVADTAGFILVYPQGSLFQGNTHWNVGAWTRGSTVDDIGFTETMIDTLAARYNIDLNRVYSCGFSNGGYFSFELACQLSNRIAAIGSVGGKMSAETFDACNPMHPTPVVTIHGTNDNTVSYDGPRPAGSKSISEVNAFWTNYNNTDPDVVVENIPNQDTRDGSTVEYHVYNNGDNCTSVEHYKVIGGGHDWPGAWGNKDINANSVIWNFVSKYDLNGLISCSVTSGTAATDGSHTIQIYPNPTKGFVTIETELFKGIECRVYSLFGELILSRKISPGNTIIDVSELPPSIYFVNVGSKTIKLIKAE